MDAIMKVGYDYKGKCFENNSLGYGYFYNEMQDESLTNNEFIFGFMMQGKDRYCGEYTEISHKTPAVSIMIRNDFGMSIPVRVKAKEKFVKELSGGRYEKKGLYELQWSLEIVKSLQKQACDFAQKVFDNYQNILEWAYSIVCNDGGDRVCISLYKDGFRTEKSGENRNVDTIRECFRGGGISFDKIPEYAPYYGRWFDYLAFSTFNLRDLNSLQMYGFALALREYIQRKEKGKKEISCEYALNGVPNGYFVNFYVNSKNVVVNQGANDW